MFVQIEVTPCDEANCGLICCSLASFAFRLFLGLGTQIHHLSCLTPPPPNGFSHSKNSTLKGSMSKLDAKNTTKLEEKQTRKTKGP